MTLWSSVFLLIEVQMKVFPKSKINFLGKFHHALIFSKGIPISGIFKPARGKFYFSIKRSR